MIPTPSRPAAARGLNAWRRAVATLLVAGAAALALAAQAALPPGVTQGPTVEGITEYTLANGLRVLLFPDATQADDDGQRHLPRRLAPRGLRRDRHGAPARAHGVQGHADDAQRLPGTRQPRHAVQRHARGSTAPTTTRRSRRPTRTSTWALEMEADRMTQSLVREGGPRHRDDGRAQRVRDRARTTRTACCGSGMLAAAYDWHNYGNVHDRRALRHRERAVSSSLQAFYQQLLPAGQRGARRRRQVRPGDDARRSSRSTSARSRSRRARCRALYTVEPVQDGERDGHRAPRRRHAAGRRAVPHPAGRAPRLPALEALAEIMTIAAVGPPVPGAGRHEEGDRASTPRTLDLHDPGTLMFWAQVPTGDSLDAAQARAARDARRRRGRSRSPTPRSIASAPGR